MMPKKKKDSAMDAASEGRAVFTICAKSDGTLVGETDDLPPEERPTGMSVPEKTLLCHLVKPAPALPYPLVPLKMFEGPDALEYQIPEAERAKVLEQEYPFLDCPKMDDTRFDLHEQKCFTVRDYRLIRECGRNLLVSPYYPHTGGMVVDWMDEEAENASMRYEKTAPKRE